MSDRLSAQLEEFWGVQLPERLKRFYDSGEYEKYDHRMVHGLAYFSSDSKMELSFNADFLPMFYEYASDVFGCEPQEMFPLAAIGDGDGTFFMAADLKSPELPVRFFDYESGFNDHSSSFDEFLSSLLEEGARTPSEVLKETYERANELRNEEKYQEAIDLLAPVADQFNPDDLDRLDHLHRFLPEAYNVLGICYEKLEQWEPAMRNYERAAKLGSDYAALNVLDAYKDREQDWDKLIEYGEDLKRRVILWSDDYVWFHVRNYLGYAYVVKGRESDAIQMYHQIRNGFGGKDPDKINEAVEDLESLAKDGRPHAELAEKILGWLRPPERKLDDDEVSRARSWWQELPPKAREALREQANVKGEDPSDDELIRITELQSIELEDMELTDVSFLAGFKRIVRLDLENNELADLSPLAGLTHLVRLDVSENNVPTLEPLSSLTRLQRLSCGENQLKSLAGLEQMNELAYLHAPENQITTLEHLAGLPELEELTVYTNQITDLSPLATCRRLKEISCFGNPVSKGLVALKDLAWLEEVDECDLSEDEIQEFRKHNPRCEIGWRDDEDEPSDEQKAAHRGWWSSLEEHAGWKSLIAKKLEDEDESDAGAPSDEALREVVEEDSLFFDDKGLDSLEPARVFENADYINVSDNDIEDLGPLAGKSRLRKLMCRKNRIRSLEPLRDVPNLDELYANGNEIASLAGLETCTQLRELRLDDNQISDLSPLRDLTELRELYLENNQIRDLSPLAGHTKLRRLDLGGNQISDVSPLKGCESLEELECFANGEMTGLMALAELPFLRKVVSYFGFDADELKAFREARPDVDVT